MRFVICALVVGVGCLGCTGSDSYGRLDGTTSAPKGTGGHVGLSGSGGRTGTGGAAAPVVASGGSDGEAGAAGAQGGAAGSRLGDGGATLSATGGRPSATGGATPATGGVSGTGGVALAATGGRNAMGGTTASTGGTAGSVSGAGGGGGSVFPAAFARFRHGISLGNRLDPPAEGDWGPVLNAADFPRIAQRGFDHVRLPIRFSSHALAVAPYTIDTTFVARLDMAVQQARAAGLAIILALSHYDELIDTPDAHRARFLALWSQIAEHHRAAGLDVAFELLSEPSGALDASWNALAVSALQTVRATNPTRVVIIASTNVAATATLATLTLPDDPNVMASIHAYEPGLFSFQGRAWMGPVYATMGVVFPGPPPSPLSPVAAATAAPWAKQWFDDYNRLPAAQNPSGPKAIATEIQQIKDFTARTGHAVYNGQWGPQAGGDTASRVSFIRMVRQECDKAGVGWAVWEDQVNLTLFDAVTGAWVEPLVGPLFP